METTQPHIPFPRQPKKDAAVRLDAVVAEYTDESSGCRFVVAEPSTQPALWSSYLEGARRSYRKHGVESVLEYDKVVDGASTSLFFAAVDTDGTLQGGMRVQGPYYQAGQAHALAEWAGRPGTDELCGEITSRLGQGVIEMKTGWVNDDARCRSELTNALARIFVHSLRLLNVRYALCTVAQHAVPRWQTTGGLVSNNVRPVEYPSARYQTVPMWWDRDTFADLAAPEQLPYILDETAQLTANRTSLRSPLISVVS